MKIKNDTITIRISSSVKEKLSVIAENENRSLSNLITLILENYCKKN